MNIQKKYLWEVFSFGFFWFIAILGAFDFQPKINKIMLMFFCINLIFILDSVYKIINLTANEHETIEQLLQERKPWLLSYMINLYIQIFLLLNFFGIPEMIVDGLYVICMLVTLYTFFKLLILESFYNLNMRKSEFSETLNKFD